VSPLVTLSIKFNVTASSQRRESGVFTAQAHRNESLRIPVLCALHKACPVDMYIQNVPQLVPRRVAFGTRSLHPLRRRLACLQCWGTTEYGVVWLGSRSQGVRDADRCNL